MSIFSGIEKARVFDRGTYFNPGTYDVRVARVLQKETETSGLALITELDVLTSKARPQEDPKGEGRTWIPTPAGIQATWFQGLTDKRVAFPAIKNFLDALLRLRPGDPRAEQLEQLIPGSEKWPANPTRRPIALISNLMEHATGGANLLAGLCVHLECSMILTRRKKEDFTLHRFSPADYAALGLPTPDFDAILRKAMMPVGSAVQPSSTGPLTPPPWGA